MAPAALALDDADGRIFVVDRGAGYSAHPAPAYGQVLADRGSMTTSMTTLDARTGAVLGTATVGATPHAIAVDGRTHRAFVLNSGPRYGYNAPERAGFSSVSVLDARTGAALRTTPLATAASHLAVAERAGHVVVSASNGPVLLDAASGGPLPSTGATTDGGPPTDGPLVVDERRGRVALVEPGPFAVGDERGRAPVDVLDAADGSYLGVHVVGFAPVAVAEDERGGQVFVVNSYGACPQDPGPLNGSVSIFPITATGA